MLTIDVAGLSVSVCGESSFEESLRERYGAFVLQSPESSVTLTLSALGSPPEKPEVIVQRKGDSYHVESGEYRCVIDAARGKGEVQMRPEETVFDSFLRVLYSALLMREDGFLIHAAGLERKGAGYLFPGRSSSGKTTLAENAGGFRVLSDELVAVRRSNGAFRVFSTPFNGEYGGAIERLDAELKKVLFLDPKREKGEVGFVEAGSVDGTVALLENVFFFLRDAESSGRALALCGELAERVPARRSGYLDGERLGEIIDDI